MSTDNLSEDSQISLTPYERREILEKTYMKLAAVVCDWCPNLDMQEVDSYLRDADFSHLGESQRVIFFHLIPEMTAAAIPPEMNKEGSTWDSFFKDTDAAEVEAGGVMLINEDGIPPSEELLRNLTAHLRAVALYADHAGRTDRRPALAKRIPFVLCEMIIKAGRKIPVKLFHLMSKKELGRLTMTAGQESKIRDCREKLRDELIEQFTLELKLPRRILEEEPEKVLEINEDIRNAVLAIWEECEKTINDGNNQLFLQIKDFLKTYPDLSVLVPWLLGETN